MKVFITGATGFIGRHLVKILNKNHNLLLLVRDSKKLSGNYYFNDAELIIGNLSNIDVWKNKLKEFQPDAAIHLAWEGIPDYGPEMSEKNLKYGSGLFKALAEIGCKRIITTGNCWEYGAKYGKLSENMTVHPSGAFSIAKNSLNLIGSKIAKENNIQFNWLRLFYVYGPGQKEDSLIPYLINSIKNSKTPKIKTLNAKNDFIYVEDVAEAILMILEKCRQNGIFNIGSGISTSILDIVKNVYTNCNSEYINEFKLSNKNNISKIDFWADISKIKNGVGWKPKIGIGKGIEKTVPHYRNNDLIGENYA